MYIYPEWKRKSVTIDPLSSKRPRIGEGIIVILDDDKDEQKLEKPITPMSQFFKLAEDDLMEELWDQVADITEKQSGGLKRFIFVNNCSEWRYFVVKTKQPLAIDTYLRKLLKKYDKLSPDSFKVLKKINDSVYELSIDPAVVFVLKPLVRQITVTYEPKSEGDPDSDSEIIPSAPSPSFRR